MKIKICPKCASINTKIPPAGLDIRMTFQDYCIDCGNRGNFPLIEEDKIKEFLKKLKVMEIKNFQHLKK